MEEGATQIVTFARHADVVLDDHVHCLELIGGADFGRLFILGRQGPASGAARLPTLRWRISRSPEPIAASACAGGVHTRRHRTHLRR
jgi:hypothetical protein